MSLLVLVYVRSSFYEACADCGCQESSLLAGFDAGMRLVMIFQPKSPFSVTSAGLRSHLLSGLASLVRLQSQSQEIPGSKNPPLSWETQRARGSGQGCGGSRAPKGTHRMQDLSQG